MKKPGLRIFLMLGLLVILAPLPAYAQSSGEQTASIPFSFVVGDKAFPAGEYRITRINPQSGKPVLAINSMDGRMSKVTLTYDVQAAEIPEQAKLIFKRYGDQHFLSQVWMPADATGLQLPKSRSERTLALHAGEGAPVRKAIALTARRR